MLTDRNGFALFFRSKNLFFALALLGPLALAAQSENCTNGIDDDGDGLIDCFDPECECSGPCESFFYQTCQIPCTYHPPCDSISLGVQWQSQANVGNFPVLVAGDIDRDGIPDIIAPKADGKSLFVLDGKTGATKVEIPFTDFIAGGSAPAIADTDGDGFGEIFVVTNDRTLFGFEHDGALKFKTSSPIGFDNGWRTPVVNIADFDQNGTAELLIGNEIFSAQNGQLLASGGPGLSRGEHPARAGSFSFCSPVAMDVLPDGFCADCEGLEIVAGNQVLSVNLATGQIKKATEAPSIYSDGYTSVADFDGDGDLDGIVQGRKSGWNCIYVWELETSQVLRSFNLFNNYFDAASRANIANYDNDPQLEISFVGQPRLYCLDNDFTVKWIKNNINDPSSVTCSSVFDFCGDGSVDVVYRSTTELAVYEGATGKVKWKDDCISATHIENPLILDVDNDGQTEIVTTCGPTADNGRVVVYEALNTPGIASRKVWNQHAYFVTNINDDLTVPRIQQSPQLVGNGLILNSFMNQFFDYRFAAPNGILTFKSLACDRDSLLLELEICNDGAKPIPAGAPLAFYRRNPQTSAASSFLYSKTLSSSIEKGNCWQLSVKILAVYNDSIFVVFNDNGSKQTPFSLKNDFPTTTLGECHFIDNMVGFYKKLTPPSLFLGADTTVCASATVKLDASGDDLAAWLWQDGSSSPTFEADDAGFFAVKTTDVCGFERSDTIQIFIDPKTVAHLGPDREICLGDTLQLAQPNFDFYAWKPSGWASCQNCSKAIFRPNVSGKIMLEAALANGCFSRDTLEVTVRDTFFQKIDTTICYGKTMFFNGQTVRTDSFGVFGFQSRFGCDSTVRVEVKGTLIGTYDLHIDSAVCLGNSLSVNGLGILPNEFRVFRLKTFQGCDSVVTIRNVPLDTFWTEESRIVCAGQSSLIFGQPRGQTGDYRMIFSSKANGCDSTHTVHLTVLPPIELAFETETSCPNEPTGSIRAVVAGSAPPFSFEWSSPQAPDQDRLAPTGAGSYDLTVTDANGCTGIGEGWVDAFEAIVFELKPTDPSCFGQRNGSISVSAADPSLVWRLDGQSIFGHDPFFSHLGPGQQTVEAQDANGCTDSKTVFLEEPPELLVDLPSDTAMGLGDTLRLAVLSNEPLDSMRFSWEPPKYLSCLDCPLPTAKPLSSVIYRLKITDPKGCEATDAMRIEIDPTPKIYVPNALKINALDAQNAEFMIEAGPSVERIEWLRIFDRWGHSVHEARSFAPGDRTAAWDGRSQGKPVGPGVFVVVAEVLLANGERIEIKSNLTVIR